jgi:hypothetical protein
VTADRQWKRLYPVRFRHLAKEENFGRWDQVRFNYGLPPQDSRAESCRVHEESIKVIGHLETKFRSGLLLPLVKRSAKHAAADGASLALIQPKIPRFTWRGKKPERIEAEKLAYRAAARQQNLFDKELTELDPTPYDFMFSFEDDDGKHHYTCGDWEIHAMFYRESRRRSAAEALRWMDGVFNEVYPKDGMAFAIGNMAKRPQVWQLLGVLKIDLSQGDLF